MRALRVRRDKGNTVGVASRSARRLCDGAGCVIASARRDGARRQRCPVRCWCRCRAWRCPVRCWCMCRAWRCRIAARRWCRPWRCRIVARRWCRPWRAGSVQRASSEKSVSNYAPFFVPFMLFRRKKVVERREDWHICTKSRRLSYACAPPIVPQAEFVGPEQKTGCPGRLTACRGRCYSVAVGRASRPASSKTAAPTGAESEEPP